MDQHFKKSVEVIKKMELGNEDIIYLSPLHFNSGDEYDKAMKKMGILPMEKAEVWAEIMRFKSILGSELPQNTKIAIYNIREFLY